MTSLQKSSKCFIIVLFTAIMHCGSEQVILPDGQCRGLESSFANEKLDAAFKRYPDKTTNQIAIDTLGMHCWIKNKNVSPDEQTVKKCEITCFKDALSKIK